MARRKLILFTTAGRRTDARGVPEVDAAVIGGRFRVLGDVLTEVADGAAEMIFVG